MPKITLTDLVNLENQTTVVNAINTNNSTLEAAADNSLSRDGSTPNEMEASLDMNSNRIINLPVPASSSEPVRKAEFDQIANDYVGNNTLLGTNNEITVTSGGGSSTFSLPSALTFTGKTVTGGTYTGATSYNKVSITAPASTATLALASGSTLTTLGTSILSGTNTGDVVSLPTGRLSLSSTSSLTTTDITGATTLWYVDCGGGAIPIWSTAVNDWVMRRFTGALSIALDSNAAHFAYQPANNSYDVYAYWDSALGSIRLGITNIAGNNFAQRGTGISGLVLLNGIWVNTLNGFLRVNNTGNTNGVDYIQPGVFQATYLGSFSTVLAGQTEDSYAKRLVFNAYNPRLRLACKKFTDASYVYNTATFRQVNADATMQVETTTGLSGIMHEVTAQHNLTCTTVPGSFRTSVTYLGGTVLSDAIGGNQGRAMDATGIFQAKYITAGYPTFGRNTWTWLEAGSGSATNTWQTDAEMSRNGIFVKVLEM